MSVSASAAPRPSGSHETLGTLWIVYGIVRLIVAIGLVLFSGTATLMFGALLARVPDPFTLMSTFHFLYIVAVVWTALSGIFGILAGVALRGGRQGAPSWMILVANFLALPDIPLGTILGIYTLVISLR